MYLLQRALILRFERICTEILAYLIRFVASEATLPQLNIVKSHSRILGSRWLRKTEIKIPRGINPQTKLMKMKLLKKNLLLRSASLWEMEVELNLWIFIKMLFFSVFDSLKSIFFWKPQEMNGKFKSRRLRNFLVNFIYNFHLRASEIPYNLLKRFCRKEAIKWMKKKINFTFMTSPKKNCSSFRAEEKVSFVKKSNFNWQIMFHFFSYFFEVLLSAQECFNKLLFSKYRHLKIMRKNCSWLMSLSVSKKKFNRTVSEKIIFIYVLSTYSPLADSLESPQFFIISSIFIQFVIVCYWWKSKFGHGS